MPAHDQPVQESPPLLRGAGDDRTVLRSEEDRGREGGGLAERDLLAGPAEAPSNSRRPLDREILGREAAPDRAADGKLLAVGRHLRRSRAPERPLAAHERGRLEQVRLALAVLAQNEVHAGPERDDVGGEVPETAGR
jgi:hypothetical protein